MNRDANAVALIKLMSLLDCITRQQNLLFGLLFLLSFQRYSFSCPPLPTFYLSCGVFHFLVFQTVLLIHKQERCMILLNNLYSSIKNINH